jgi:hypothetical protein
MQSAELDDQLDCRIAVIPRNFLDSRQRFRCERTVPLAAEEGQQFFGVAWGKRHSAILRS